MTDGKKITVLIVDDEPLARHGLREILSQEKDLSIIDEAEDGDEAVEKILRHRPDAVFLDIQMPEQNGFEVLAQLSPEQFPLIVFVTAFDEFAIKAFAANALDYLMKPADDDRVRLSVSKIREMIRLKQGAVQAGKISSLLSSMGQDPPHISRIPVKSGNKITFVRTDEIYWLEAAADYVHLHTHGTKHTIRESITVLEKQLDPRLFVRIHRSTIVNLRQIRELRPLHHGEYEVLLTDGTTLTVSRTYRHKLDSLL